MTTLQTGDMTPTANGAAVIGRKSGRGFYTYS